MCSLVLSKLSTLSLRAAARCAVKSLPRQGAQLLFFPQNLIEFRNASTRPATANDLGFTPEQAACCLDRFQTLSDLLAPRLEVACEKCGRKGSYSVAKLYAERGERWAVTIAGDTEDDRWWQAA